MAGYHSPCIIDRPSSGSTDTSQIAAEVARPAIETADRSPVEAAATGFMSGFLRPVAAWREGASEIGSSVGLHGPQEQARAREDQATLGREIRAVEAVATNPEARQKAREAYDELPKPAQQQLTNAAAEAGGRTAAGMVTSSAVAWGVGAFVGAMLARSPRTIAHAPHVRSVAKIWMGALLSGVAFVGNGAMALRAQNQVFSAVPGSREELEKGLKRVLEKQ